MHPVPVPVIEKMLQRLRINDPEVFRTIRPEEAAGFVSRAELGKARDNVIAAIKGEEIPNPPSNQEGQDHVGRLELYLSIKALLEALGQEVEVLNQLIQPSRTPSWQARLVA